MPRPNPAGGRAVNSQSSSRDACHSTPEPLPQVGARPGGGRPPRRTQARTMVTLGDSSFHTKTALSNKSPRKAQALGLRALAR
jgi:hypothetical protein